MVLLKLKIFRKLFLLYFFIGMILFLNLFFWVVFQVSWCECVLNLFCVLWLILCILLSIFVVRFIMFEVLVVYRDRCGFGLMLCIMLMWFMCFMLLMMNILLLLVWIVWVVVCSVFIDELYRWLMVCVVLVCGIWVISDVMCVMFQFCFRVWLMQFQIMFFILVGLIFGLCFSSLLIRCVDMVLVWVLWCMLFLE